jgi:hypothetical protein
MNRERPITTRLQTNAPAVDAELERLETALQRYASMRSAESPALSLANVTRAETLRLSAASLRQTLRESPDPNAVDRVVEELALLRRAAQPLLEEL